MPGPLFRRMTSRQNLFAGAALLLLTCAAFAQELRTPTLVARLRADTQTLASLSPVADRDFDFLPSHLAKPRRGDGYAHLGDLNVRLRTGAGEWRDFSSYRHRVAVRRLSAHGATSSGSGNGHDGESVAADISATLGEDLPLRVIRRWRVDGRVLVLAFSLTNTGNVDVEIGGLGMPLVFDNILDGRTLDEAHTQASFADPSIANDAGYVQVTRLNGRGPALLVLPDGHSPLEAWRPLLDDATQRGHTFEGFHEWMLASRGYASKEWAKAGEPWNPPTSFTLKPGESREFGLRFVTAPTIRAIESVLIAERRPVVVGIPGYVLPTDLEGALFVAAPSRIERFEISPAGALTLEAAGAAQGWQRYSVRGRQWGRARLGIHYADGSTQTVNWFVTKPATEAARDLASFITRRQFFDDAGDPFGRAPGILSFDRDADRLVTQDTRVWISGMSDEGGAGSWVAAIVKQLADPDPAEVALLERVVDETIDGELQVNEGKHAGGVKKSLFWYDPRRLPGYYDPDADWSTWTSWSKEHAASLERSFNYPHVAAGYWVLYRLARDHAGLVTRHDWRWYLERATLTSLAMTREAPYYSQFGQMEGEVFLEILRDLRREGLDARAGELEAVMKKRADHWRTLAYPFGSEMPWDSTGQPEVYAWLRHFGDDARAAQTREVILGYDPCIPGWGYNGNARRYWDFLYGGKIRRVERQIHHYGSALNAVPLFDAYRANPADFHLLRVAYGGLMGALTNIDQRGFGSAAFHSWPDEMRFDALTGDYGMGFFGHAYATASYLVDHPTFGWLAFGGNLSRTGDAIRIEPRDSARTRLFIAPAKLWITLAAGRIDAAEYSPADGAVRLWLAPTDSHTPRALLSVEVAGRSVAPAANGERGYQSVTLGSSATLVNLPGAH